MKKSLIIILLFLGTLFAGCAIMHTYSSYYGKVIDAETKEPIKGAVVLAVYYTQQYGPAGSVNHYVDAQETVTDENGEFKIPFLTVKTFRIGHSFEPYAWFWIFKPGFGCYPFHKDVKPIFLPNGTLPEDKYVIVEIPKLKTKEERLKNTM